MQKCDAAETLSKNLRDERKPTGTKRERTNSSLSRNNLAESYITTTLELEGNSQHYYMKAIHGARKVPSYDSKSNDQQVTAHKIISGCIVGNQPSKDQP